MDKVELKKVSMLQVNKSKEFRSVNQLVRMAENLSRKTEDYCSVVVDMSAMPGAGLKPRSYRIWLGGTREWFAFSAWREMQDKYFEIIKNDSGKYEFGEVEKGGE